MQRYFTLQKIEKVLKYSAFRNVQTTLTSKRSTVHHVDSQVLRLNLK